MLPDSCSIPEDKSGGNWDIWAFIITEQRRSYKPKNYKYKQALRAAYYSTQVRCILIRIKCTNGYLYACMHFDDPKNKTKKHFCIIVILLFGYSAHRYKQKTKKNKHSESRTLRISLEVPARSYPQKHDNCLVTKNLLSLKTKWFLHSKPGHPTFTKPHQIQTKSRLKFYEESTGEKHRNYTRFEIEIMIVRLECQLQFQW